MSFFVFYPYLVLLSLTFRLLRSFKARAVRWFEVPVTLCAILCANLCATFIYVRHVRHFCAHKIPNREVHARYRRGTPILILYESTSRHEVLYNVPRARYSLLPHFVPHYQHSTTITTITTLWDDSWMLVRVFCHIFKLIGVVQVLIFIIFVHFCSSNQISNDITIIINLIIFLDSGP